MAPSVPSSPPLPPETELRKLDRALEEIAALCRSGVDPDEYWQALATALATMTSALGAIVWRCEGQGEYSPAGVSGGVVGRLAAEQLSADSRHSAQLDEVGRSAATRIATAPQTLSLAAGETTAVLALFYPLAVDGMAFAVLELLQPNTAPADSLRQAATCIDAVAELAVDYEVQRQRRALLSENSWWRQLVDFGQQLHGSIGAAAKGMEIANRGRELLGCDRLSVVGTGRGGARVLAVSGVEQIERRAEAVRAMERLVRQVAPWNESLWTHRLGEDLPPEIQGAVDAYRELSHARHVGVVPLACGEDDSNEPPRQVGALVVDIFHAAEVDSIADRAATFASYSAAALQEAIEYQTPLTRLLGAALPSRSVGAGRRWAWIAAAGILALAVTLLVLVPAELVIEAPGELQPSEQYHIFAPRDGVVRALHADHYAAVRAGQPLAELHSVELDLEFRRVQGEIDAARERLHAIQSSRTSGPRDGRSSQPPAELSAAQQELTKLLESYQQQLEILRAQQQELTIQSPIDGRVLSWDLDRQLASRPVQRGQRLMTVANVDGPWQLELQVPDQDIGHVLDAQQAGDEPLAVSYILPSQPGHTYHGQLRRVAQIADREPDGRIAVVVTAQIDSAAHHALRPGASVSAQIHCGSRPVGYVWLRRLIEFVQSRILF